ncbi:MAG: hypothetical protein GXO42_00765 [bacterium]|nr:hypothetical protein [bacterium]
MCRAFFVAGDAANYTAAKLAKLSYELYNRDGYFFACNTGKHLRTLDFTEYYKMLLKESYTAVLCHLRSASRGEVNEKNVHGWKFKFLGDYWYCVHHGTIEGFGEGELCDSYYFFSSLEGSSSIEEIANRIRRMYRRGSGAFFAVNLLFTQLLIIIIYHPVYHLKRQENEIIASKSDILRDFSGQLHIYSDNSILLFTVPEINLEEKIALEL